MFGLAIDNEEYSKAYDFNEDEIVDILESAWVIKDYGKIRNINF